MYKQGIAANPKGEDCLGVSNDDPKIVPQTMRSQRRVPRYERPLNLRQNPDACIKSGSEYVAGAHGHRFGVERNGRGHLGLKCREKREVACSEG